MQNLKFTLLLFLGLFVSGESLMAQCSFSANSGGFDYAVNINDLSVDNVIYTQAGSTCNVNIVVGYDISIITNGVQPSWWSPQDMDVLQGNFNCVGGSGASFFNLPNIGGQGTATSATFSYANTQCSNVVLDCPITLQIGGPGGLSDNGPCGNLINVVLPVELTEFVYKETGANQIEVRWETEQEENMDYYILEGSTDLNSWQEISQHKAQNSERVTTYYQDVHRLSQKQYLRLKMIDVEGKIQYSKVITVSKSNQASLALHPNPVLNELQIIGANASDIKIINSVGLLMVVPVLTKSSLNVSGLPTGLYFVRSINGGQQAIQFFKK